MGLQVVVAPAQSSTWVAFVQQLADQILGVLHEVVAVVFHEVREFKVACHDLVVYLLHVISVKFNKGIFSSQQLVEDGSEGPQVSAVGVALVNEDLGGHVLRGSYEAEGLVLILKHLLAGAHIDQLQIPVSADHNVFRFQVAVDNSFLVECLQDVDQQCDVEPGLLKGQDPNASDHIKEILAFDVLCQEVDVVAIFEGAEVFNKEGGIFQTYQVQSLLFFLG